MPAEIRFFHKAAAAAFPLLQDIVSACQDNGRKGLRK